MACVDAPGGGRRLVFVTDPEMPADVTLATLAASLRGGVDEVILRLPQLGAGALYDLAKRAAWLAAGSSAMLVIHDRVDVALAIPGAGVHLGQASLRPDVVRRMAPDRRIGVSVHSVAEALAAVASGADCLLFGHVHATASHPHEPARGLDGLREVVGSVDVPVIAIGGITVERVEPVMENGAAGVAAIRAISRAEDPEAATLALRRALDRTLRTQPSDSWRQRCT